MLTLNCDVTVDLISHPFHKLYVLASFCSHCLHSARSKGF